jgi:hypothetical protein
MEEPRSLSGEVKSEPTIWRMLSVSPTVRFAGFTLLLGLLVNYSTESRGTTNWFDLLLATVAFGLTMTAVILFLFSLKPRLRDRGIRHCLLLTLAVSVPLTGLYAVFYFGMQSIKTSADGYGQCPQIAEVANATGVIPESLAFPGNPAVGCSNLRHGMFLMPYYEISVYGVTDPSEQARVMQGLANYRSSGATLPIRVKFYEHSNWIQHPGKYGPGWGERGQPERLLRVFYLH